jgi:transcription antitermination factor NusG
MQCVLADSNAINFELVLDRPQWFAISTNPKQEERTCHNLRVLNIESFNPRIQESRCNQFTGAVTLIPTSLFPRYIFARFVAGHSLRTVRYTRGVLKVVCFNSQPAPIDDGVIEFLKSRVGDNGFLNVSEALNPGDKVRIKDGPWKEFSGVIERDIPANARVQILLTAINYHARLVTERHWVEKVN